MSDSLRDHIARAIYEEPGKNDGAWASLSQEKRTSWLADADRVQSAIAEYQIPEMDTSLAGRPSAGAAGLGKGAARSSASQSSLSERVVKRLHEMEARFERIAAGMRGDPEGVYDDSATCAEAAQVIEGLTSHTGATHGVKE